MPDICGQLRFTDPSIQGCTQLRHLRILVLGDKRREVQLVIDAQRPSLGSRRDSRHPYLGGLHEGLKEYSRIVREP
jgi:hypothetical protein